MNFKKLPLIIEKIMVFKLKNIFFRILKSDKFVQNVVDGWDARCQEGKF